QNCRVRTAAAAGSERSEAEKKAGREIERRDNVRVAVVTRDESAKRQPMLMIRLN
ncbi:hypothetical protein ALC62_09984, partial [Cyphomyrmex costatus]